MRVGPDGGVVEVDVAEMDHFDRAVMACAGAAFVAMTEGEDMNSARMSLGDSEILNNAIGELGGKGVIARNAWHRAEGIAMDWERPIRQLAAVLSVKHAMNAEDIALAIHTEPALISLRKMFPKPVVKPVTPSHQFPRTTIHLRPLFPMSARSESTIPRTTFAAFGKPMTLATEMSAKRVAEVVGRHPHLRKRGTLRHVTAALKQTIRLPPSLDGSKGLAGAGSF